MTPSPDGGWLMELARGPEGRFEIACERVGGTVRVTGHAVLQHPREHMVQPITVVIRNAVVPYWYQTRTAKMGRHGISVVDGEHMVYAIERLRIADGSVLPRLTTGNTMAPCVIVGEKASEAIGRRHFS